MAPSLHKLKQVAAKKRKATGTVSPAEGRAATKVPRRADAGRVSGRETGAGMADTGGAMAVKPPRVQVPKKGGPKRAVTKVVSAPESKAVGPVCIGEAIRPRVEEPVLEDTAQAEAGKEVEQSPPAEESPAPAPIILLDLSPEGKIPSPAPTEAGEAPVATAAAPAAVLPPAEAPLPAKGPGTAGSEAESTSAGPSSREGRTIDPSFQSLLANHSRWATRVIEEASVEEMQEYLRSRKSGAFFREASVAHLWALNSLVALKDIWTLSDTALEQAHEEMVSLQVKAEKSAMALEDTRATLMGEVGATRLRAEKAEYALEVAQRRAAHELDNAQVAEEKQKAAEEKLTATEEKLVAAEQEVNVLKTRLSYASAETNAVKEATRQHIIKIADLEALVVEAQRKATEAERRGTNIIEDYKKSAAFDDEVADSAALAYDAGFQDCKKKIQELYDLEDIEDLQPDDVPEDDVPPSDAH